MKFFKIFIFLFFTSKSLLSSEYEITVLATNTANFGGIGEWSFAALLESDHEKILFDTGFDENTVIHNAQLLNKDLSTVEKVVLSHFHGDHTGGLIKLRKTFVNKNPNAFSKVYVADGFFEQRYDNEGNLRGFIGGYNDVDNFLAETKKLGINFITIRAPIEIATN
jgi:7,8-dihydropterin-6-yl-methyl-4-(beta-D-ribofuranosyl)aminobenzene 5'-phosphate synthase